MSSENLQRRQKSEVRIGDWAAAADFPSLNMRQEAVGKRHEWGRDLRFGGHYGDVGLVLALFN